VLAVPNKDRDLAKTEALLVIAEEIDELVKPLQPGDATQLKDAAAKVIAALKTKV